MQIGQWWWSSGQRARLLFRWSTSNPALFQQLGGQCCNLFYKRSSNFKLPMIATLSCLCKLIDILQHQKYLSGFIEAGHQAFLKTLSICHKQILESWIKIIWLILLNKLNFSLTLLLYSKIWLEHWLQNRDILVSKKYQLLPSWWQNNCNRIFSLCCLL